MFLDPDGTYLSDVEVGFLPDALIFSPDGRTAVVANEGEPNDDYTIDPEGTVSVIDLSGGAAERSATTFVTLQENNAIVAIDVASGEITDLFGLGFKDHTDPANGRDASNADGEINIRSWPVMGIYQPDALAAYDVEDEKFLVTANEGDARSYDGFSEEERFGDVELCPEFPDYDGMDAEELQEDENLGRLNITTVNGFDDERGCVQEIHAYGGRSFSIYTADGEQVFDSGREFEEITAAELGRQGFNANNDESRADAFDTRSDDRGPEPEGVAVDEAYGETYAFIGLERVGGVMTYRVSDPSNAEFVDYTTSRQFDVADPEDSVDLGPEGVIFVTAKDSPTGRPLVVLSHEVTGTTTIYQVDPVAPARDAGGPAVHVVDLQPLNDSGVGGKAILVRRDDELRVVIVARGLEPGMSHAQHIHGLDRGEDAVCPPSEAADSIDGQPEEASDPDEFISLEEGLPFYGEVLLPLTPFPDASRAGVVTYNEAFAVSGDLLDLTDEAVVLHGMTLDGGYAGSLPVACGAID